MRRPGGREECSLDKLSWHGEWLLHCVGCGPFPSVGVRVVWLFACVLQLLRVLYSIVFSRQDPISEWSITRVGMFGSIG